MVSDQKLNIIRAYEPSRWSFSSWFSPMYRFFSWCDRPIFSAHLLSATAFCLLVTLRCAWFSAFLFSLHVKCICARKSNRVLFCCLACRHTNFNNATAFLYNSLYNWKWVNGQTVQGWVGEWDLGGHSFFSPGKEGSGDRIRLSPRWD